MPAHTLFVNGHRYGYYHYNRDWRDDYFAYSFYVFDPYAYDRCYASPFYYYVSLPPYVNSTRIIVGNSRFVFLNDYEYRWHRPYGDTRGDYTELDYAVDDIVVAFEDANSRAVNRLVPRDGRVNILHDGRYDYSLQADDFYDMFRDATKNAETSKYEILNVRMNGRSAKVYARHSYIDPWGQRAFVYHTYFLEREGGSYVIREFDSSGQN